MAISLPSSGIETATVISYIDNCIAANNNKPASTSFNQRSKDVKMNKKDVLERIASFKKKIMANKITDRNGNDSLSGNAYIGYNINVKKRNASLQLIPSMYYIAHGKRIYAGETLNRFILSDGKVKQMNIKLSTGTVPKNKNVLSIMKNLIVPDIYGETIFGEFLLSPCNTFNMSLYKYKMTRLTYDRIEIVFKPKVKNTQLVSGKAIINEETGRILMASFIGELDMIKFHVYMFMGFMPGKLSTVPQFCNVKGELNFMGNEVESNCNIYYNTMDNNVLDSIDSKDINTKALMERLRPLPLLKDIKDVYDEAQLESFRPESLQTVQQNDSSHNKASGFKKIVSSLGDYFVDRISGNFGTKAQGNYRISPLMNPLSLGYSSRKGVTYKLRLYGGYRFSDNSDISIVMKSGYSFKQRQFYTSVPLKLNFNRTLALETEFGMGNRITNSEILDRIKDEKYDSIKWDKMNLDYFKDLYWKVKLKIRIDKKWNVTPGVIFHRRSAVEKEDFILSGMPYKYHSFAPTLQLQYQPWLDKGPVFTVDYERGMKGVIHSSMDYERIETDISWKKYLHSMRQLSMKFGYGIYTSRSKNTYFLDFANFRYENIPGGWDDDWTGEFQLLNSNWYNASRFYTMSNLTYESPLLLMSRLPFIGKYIETERIYCNWLFTDMLHPYVEPGYGFTNKFFSMGVFFSMSNKKYKGFGVRFGLELFKDW